MLTTKNTVIASSLSRPLFKSPAVLGQLPPAQVQPPCCMQRVCATAESCVASRSVSKRRRRHRWMNGRYRKRARTGSFVGVRPNPRLATVTTKAAPTPPARMTSNPRKERPSRPHQRLWNLRRRQRQRMRRRAAFGGQPSCAHDVVVLGTVMPVSPSGGDCVDTLQAPPGLQVADNMCCKTNHPERDTWQASATHAGADVACPVGRDHLPSTCLACGHNACPNNFVMRPGAPVNTTGFIILHGERGFHNTDHTAESHPGELPRSPDMSGSDSDGGSDSSLAMDLCSADDAFSPLDTCEETELVESLFR